MKKVKLLKRLIARDENGKQTFRTQGSIAFLDDASFKLHLAMGIVEEVPDEPKPKPEPAPEPEPAPAPEPEPAPAPAASEVEPDAGDDIV